MADVFSLDKLSIKKLKALAGRNNVSLRGCFEKSDIIKTLRDAGVKEHSGPPPASSSSNEASGRSPSRDVSSSGAGSCGCG